MGEWRKARRPTRSWNELIESVRHIRYEVAAMVGQTLEVDAVRRLGAPEEMIGAYLEASLVHVPNMTEFLTFTASRTDTRMHPIDFRTPWQGKLTNPRINELVNRHLAHVRWERVTDPLPG